MSDGKKESRRLASMISVRVSPEEERELRSAATKRGISMSNLLREAALAQCRSEGAAINIDVMSTGQIAPAYAQGGEPVQWSNEGLRTMVLTTDS